MPNGSQQLIDALRKAQTSVVAPEIDDVPRMAGEVMEALEGFDESDTAGQGAAVIRKEAGKIAFHSVDTPSLDSFQYLFERLINTLMHSLGGDWEQTYKLHQLPSRNPPLVNGCSGGCCCGH